MTLKIWLKIFLIILLVSLPLTAVQYFLQKESLELALEIAEKTTPVELLESHMRLLKKFSKVDPENQGIYRKEFEKIAEVKFASEDLKLVKKHLVANLLKQTLRNVVIVLLIFLGLSFLISKQIVYSFKKLLEQIQSQSHRLERLNSIESWQKIARMLVHELRAPITPIKLVSTDIEHKFEVLERDVFRSYLREGASLIQEQVQSVERLLESFTRFAKLPDVKKSQESILRFLEGFITHYTGFNQGQIELKLEKEEVLQETINFDSQALKHLFFNLMKNACEANVDQKIYIRIKVRQNTEKTWIRFQNTGCEIPLEVAKRIFDLHVSTKDHFESSNFGIGLTISKKIALDHGGDLYLTSTKKDEVSFELELPNL